MPMTVGAALITKKAPNAEFNTDSINVSGKTWPREVVHGDVGIRAAGSFSGTPYFMLAGGANKGTAESAVDLFNYCKAKLNEENRIPSEVISDFFNAFAKQVSATEQTSGDYNMALFAGKGCEVVVAKSGDMKLYSYSDDKLIEAVPQMFDYADGKAQYGVCSFPAVKINDTFILLNAQVAKVISEGLLLSMCRKCAGDIKKLVQYIGVNAEKRGCNGAVSVAVIKIEDADMPRTIIPEENNNNDTSLAEGYIPQIIDDTPDKTDELKPAEKTPVEEQADLAENNGGKSKKGAYAVVLAIFVILAFMLAVLSVYGIRFYRTRKGIGDETTTQVTTTVLDEPSVTQETTEEAKTGDEAQTTTEKTSVAAKTTESTTKKQEATAKTSDTTTKAAETTTEKNELTTSETTTAQTTTLSEETTAKRDNESDITDATTTTREPVTDASGDTTIPPVG